MKVLRQIKIKRELKKEKIELSDSDRQWEERREWEIMFERERNMKG